MEGVYPAGAGMNDVLPTGSGTATITAAPEPATLSLLTPRLALLALDANLEGLATTLANFLGSPLLRFPCKRGKCWYLGLH